MAKTNIEKCVADKLIPIVGCITTATIDTIAYVSFCKL